MHVAIYYKLYTFCQKKKFLKICFYIINCLINVVNKLNKTQLIRDVLNNIMEVDVLNLKAILNHSF